LFSTTRRLKMTQQLINLSTSYRRPLHWVFKIGDLKAAVDTYINVFGMHILRHEEFSSGCEATCNGPYGGAWSKTMIGYGSEETHTCLELTYNYGISFYEMGNDYRYIAMLKSLLPSNFFEKAASAGIKVEEEKVGKILTMPHDGYKFLIVDSPFIPEFQPSDDPFLHVSLHVNSLEKILPYYRDVLGFKVMLDHSTDAKSPRVIVGFGKSFKVELVQLPKGQTVNHALAIGRMATETEDDAQGKVEHNVMLASNGSREKIVHGPMALPPHNEKVIIVKDPDGYEYCFVEASGFKKCTKAGTKTIDWATREQFEPKTFNVGNTEKFKF